MTVMDAEPVFILAPPRSFTSVVSAMIGQHPELYGLPEVNLFAADTVGELDRWHGMRRRLRHGLLRAVAELGLGGQDEAAIETADAWLRQNTHVRTAQIHGDLAAWAGPRRLVDKSPIYVIDEGALERIWSAFPAARFIHMTRHPVGTLTSMLGLRDYVQKAGGIAARGATTDPDRFWLQPHARAKAFLDSLPADRWIRMRGEDLRADPDLYLPQIAEWLGLRTDSAAIAAMKHPEKSPFARMGPPNARFGNDPGFMEQPALRPYAGKPASLDDPLPDGVTGPFSESLRHYAGLFGYS
jgi:hypothetical protein